MTDWKSYSLTAAFALVFVLIFIILLAGLGYASKKIYECVLSVS